MHIYVGASKEFVVVEGLVGGFYGERCTWRVEGKGGYYKFENNPNLAWGFRNIDFFKGIKQKCDFLLSENNITSKLSIPFNTEQTYTLSQRQNYTY